MNVSISFLIPVYNAENYLDRCLQSIYSQIEGSNHEVVLVDDGSTDNSGKICDKYKSLYPENTKVFHKPNEGISRTRNFLLKNASKDYIWFVDSDDFIQEGALEKLIHLVREYGHQDIISFSYKHYKEDGYSELKNSRCDIRALSGSDYIKEGNINSYLWAHLFNLNVVKSRNILFYEEINIMEDLMFILSLCCESRKVLLANVYGYNYYVGNVNSTMASKDIQHRLLNAEYSYKAIHGMNRLLEIYVKEDFYPGLKAIIANTVSGFIYVFLLCNFDYKIVKHYIDKLEKIGQYPINKCSNRKVNIFSKFANCKMLFLFLCKMRNIMNRKNVIKT